MNSAKSTLKRTKNSAPLSAQQQTGVSLVEVLVAVLIMSIGMLGLAAMQNTSVKFAYDSYIRSQANFLAYDLMDRVRSNPDAAYALSQGQVPSTASCVATTASVSATNCSATEIRAADLYEWYQSAIAVFPDATLQLEQPSNGQYVMRISWDDRYELDNLDNEAEREQFIYRFDVR